MTKETIEQMIRAIYDPTVIHTINIDINQYNHQPDKIQIIFKDSYNCLSLLGHIMDKLETLVIDDEYGDLTECKIEYTTYHDDPDPGEGLTTALTLLPNIDS